MLEENNEKTFNLELLSTKEFLDAGQKIVNNNSLILNLNNNLEIKESNDNIIKNKAKDLFYTPKNIREGKINDELNKIRWKRDDKEKISNAKWLKLEDGSFAIQIGNKVKKLNKKEELLNILSKKNSLLMKRTQINMEYCDNIINN